jgi:hypothetical protein
MLPDMNTECEIASDRWGARRGIDLEEFKLARGLSYRKLASLIGSTHASQARCWAIGESRPDADQLELIIRKTDGAVSVEAMHQKRLAWLKENNKCTALAACVAEGEAVDHDNHHAT